MFEALSEALQNQVRLVAEEKKAMIDEAKRMIIAIRQMEASLDGTELRRSHSIEDKELKITYPLTRCLQTIKEKHIQVSRLHRERYEQVKSTSRTSATCWQPTRLTFHRTCPGTRIIFSSSRADICSGYPPSDGR